MLVYLGEEIGLPARGRVLNMLRLLQKEPPDWLRNVQPAYCSLMVTFDPCRVDHAEVEAILRKFENRAKTTRPATPRTVEIPVCYGGEFGPDLDDVATPTSWDSRRDSPIWATWRRRLPRLGWNPRAKKFQREVWELPEGKRPSIRLPRPAGGG
jgi:inhibitor of KinA